MDYGELLYQAHSNHVNAVKKEVPCYKTKFPPPKKLERPSVSSANVKKFLARKEAEDKLKLLEAKRKKLELLALRSQDKKAQKRVQIMLKNTKSANKSVMDDAIDNMNTAHTLEGPMQCDEDDYGYVSQEASAFYAKMMHKYENMPTEESIFSKSKRVAKDLGAAKDRVKAALQREVEEAEQPHKRKRKKENQVDGEARELEKSKQKGKSKEEEIDERIEEKKVEIKKPRKPAPPPLQFDQLLKIAEKKQFQPILIEVPKVKEPERPLTRKEKLERLREEERKLEKSKGRSVRFSDEKAAVKKDEKVNQKPKINPEKQKRDITKTDSKPSPNVTQALKKDASVWRKPCNLSEESKQKSNKPIVSKTLVKSLPLPEKKTNICKEIEKDVTTSLTDIDRQIEMLMKQKQLLAGANKSQIKPSQQKYQHDSRPRPGEKKNLIPSQQRKPLPVKKKLPPGRRRIESDSEHDSELDDFIDDGPEDGQDYSKYISEIFGYDKSRYHNDIEDDDECMESNFAQQMKEEFVSSKIGLMEDLEDIRKEQEEKKLKSKKRKLQGR